MSELNNLQNDPSTVLTPRKKTMSEAALAANRANAKKCTGPKTREGKFKASLNALKHGLYSHTFIIKTEDAAVFENFSKSFIDEFQPATPSELELLKQLISAAWRRNRISELIQIRHSPKYQKTAWPHTAPSSPSKNSMQRNPPLPGWKPTNSVSVRSSSASSAVSIPSARKNLGTKPNSTGTLYSAPPIRASNIHPQPTARDSPKQRRACSLTS